ncbi:sigma-70 family RNA polymerase sigma factor [Citreicella sp. C3M06]|uniref:sigma-70 family RNA polymerase sigma factor n=1 Tax=Citreicella sp. C3M06 TaxID=2841564 RepID=UPI001C0A4651|nr:sigma-70 family RNA polymerase sigma factor [Citreicella sp. C3M06]MBU2963559.1 sigma-70 family RNA polymerase sigma factor [Citreicella sp. C3M06]
MTGPDAEIEALMRQGLAGDRKAYGRALALLAPRMRAMATRDLPQTMAHMAEDVVQEALLSIHLKRGSWEPSRPLLPWVRVIVKHKAIDALRAGARRQHEPIEDHPQIGAPEVDPLEGLHIEQALARLAPRDAELVREHAVMGADAETLSARFDLSPGALRVALHRALRRLAEAARKDEEWRPTN